MKQIAWDKENNVAIEPEREPINFEWMRETNGKVVIFKQYHEPVAPDLDATKAAKITQIKQEANERISALDWVLSRATRHVGLGKAPKKSLAEVYQMQDDIEVASDAAEIAVNLLTTAEEIKQFTW